MLLERLPAPCSRPDNYGTPVPLLYRVGIRNASDLKWRARLDPPARVRSRMPIVWTCEPESTASHSMDRRRKVMRHAVRPIGFYGLSEFARFDRLAGKMGRHLPRPGKRLMTSKSESVGFSWDPTEPRVTLGPFLIAPREALHVPNTASSCRPESAYPRRASD